MISDLEMSQNSGIVYPDRRSYQKLQVARLDWVRLQGQLASAFEADLAEDQILLRRAWRENIESLKGG
jgi:hypothetical protein